MFGSKRDEVTGDWRVLHKEVHYNLQPSPNIIQVVKSRMMRWVGHVAQMGERRDVYMVLVARCEGQRPLGMPRLRWEGDIEMDL
jgi:hypothetical protein